MRSGDIWEFRFTQKLPKKEKNTLYTRLENISGSISICYYKENLKMSLNVLPIKLISVLFFCCIGVTMNPGGLMGVYSTQGGDYGGKRVKGKQKWMAV